ncbi:MAG: amino acid adenylation domain-containing protein [Fuerstiella sp.]
MSLENVEDLYSPSPMQQGMLFHSITEPNSGVYVQQVVQRLEGPVQTDLFEAAWNDVTERHTALRAAFLWEGLDEPLQVIRQEVKIPWIHLDWRNLSIDQQKANERQLLKDDRTLGFQLANAPLTRMHLIRTGEEQWSWIWSFHHILCDGWSGAVIQREFEASYSARRKGQVPYQRVVSAPAFRDLLQWREQQSDAEADAYWSRLLHDVNPGTIQKSGHRNPDGTKEQRQCVRSISDEQTNSLKVFAASNRLTLNTLLHSAWSVLLSRRISGGDIVYGMTVSGRPADLPNAEFAVGLYINTLPVRIDPTLNAFGSVEWMQNLQNQLLESREFEFSSLSRIKNISKVSGDLFETLLVFENYPSARTDEFETGFQIRHKQHFEQSNFPLALLVVPGSQIELIAVYDTSLFDGNEVEVMLADLEQILDGYLQASLRKPFTPNIPTSNLPTSLQSKPDSQTILDAFHHHCMVSPNAVAVVFENQRVSYSQLAIHSDAISDDLIAIGVAPNEPVLICCDRSVEMIASVLGVLKAGGAYVPVNPDQPESRIRNIAIDCGAKTIVVGPQHSILAANCSLNLVEAICSHARPRASHQTRVPNPDDLAYVMYTSGSTGKPKGVEVTHRALIRSTQARSEFYRDSPDAFLMLSSIWFDSSVAGLFWTLGAGGTLVIPNQSSVTEIKQLAHLIDQERITHTLCLPSIYYLILQHSHGTSLETLECVIVAGEACSRDIVDEHIRRRSRTKLFNEYGPTEASVWATASDLSAETESRDVPIGKAAPGCQIYLLDELRQPTADGMLGEIYIGGARLANGYRGNPELTQQRFLEHQGQRVYQTGDLARRRQDGQLIFVGRADDQIKINGQRIEPSEIETAILKMPQVREAVVGFAEQPVDASIDRLLGELTKRTASEAQHLLASIEDKTAMPENFAGRAVESHVGDVSVKFEFGHPEFISTARESHRTWLINQALAETTSDLNHLHKLAPTMAKGSDLPHVPRDLSLAQLSAEEIMEDWQSPLMQSMAEFTCQAGDHVLEIGFGRGIAASYIQACQPDSHTIIEMNPYSVSDFFEPWKTQHKHKTIHLIEGRWQDILHQLDQYDAIFFHAFPMNESEFVEFIAESATFAEHFFETAAKLLKPGGAFTYMTTEIDSLSRRHQRALFQNFHEVQMKVQRLNVPQDTKDAWWAQTMVVLKAIAEGQN